MRILRRWTELTKDDRGAVIAIGNFDGVHRGHAAVIAAARAHADKHHWPVGVLTFEPHPRSVFRPTDPPFRLTPEPMKLWLLARHGLDFCVVATFDNSIRMLSATDFIERILVDALGIRHVVVGEDFLFGHDRGGDADLLRSIGRKHGFGVSQVAPFGAGGKVFSSSAARDRLRMGDPAGATAILGHRWEIAGTVVPGDGRGHAIGFPTANIALGDYVRPALGVYAGLASWDGQEPPTWRHAVANLGIRPTFGGSAERLEVHVLNANEDLYGRTLRVHLCHFIRPERKFDGIDALKAQIRQDAASAREHFSEINVPDPLVEA